MRECALGAYAHQELPFEKLVECLRVERDPSWNPLFQVNFRGRSASDETLELPGLSAQTIQVDLGFSRFDLALEIEIDDEAVRGYFEYDEDLFDPATIETLASDLEALLHRIALAPETPILALARGQGRSLGRRQTAGRISRSVR